MRMWGLFLLAVGLVACSGPRGGSVDRLPEVLGLLKVTVTGLGDGTTPEATAEWVHSRVSRQSATVMPINGTAALNDVQFTRRAVNFSDDDRSSTRYVYTTLGVINRTTTNFANLTLYAVNVPANIGGTGIAAMSAATGSAITSESVARGFQPVHAVRPVIGAVQVNEDLADLQVFSASEVDNPTDGIKQQAVAQGILTNNATVLQYGFVARNLSGGRSIAARDSNVLPACTSLACTGTVTLAYKFPRISPRQNNPFSFTLYFVVANESSSLVSQSIEEQTAGTIAGLTSTTSFFQTRVLAGSTFGLAQNNLNNLCQVRTAVATLANPSDIRMPSSIPTTAGSLDLCFGAGGKRLSKLNTTSETARAIALQSDGKIVVAGASYNGSDYDLALSRYNSNGSLDTSFDSDGKLTTAFASSEDWGSSVAIQSDGKIIVAGHSYNGPTSDYALARYNPDGSLDTTFDTDGKVTTDIAGNVDKINAIALQSDGKIVVAGQSVTSASYAFSLARYNTNGSLDSSFGTGGKLTTQVSGASGLSYGQSIALQSDGKIVVAGHAYNTTTLNYDFALARYNTNGSLDTSFGSAGIAKTDIGSIDNYAYAAALQSDGKIVVAGWSDGGGTNIDFTLARYNTNGSLDTAFDTDGKVSTDFNSNIDVANALAIQSDGKIAVAGYSQIGTDNDFALARYNPNGSLDTSFDGDGKLTTDFASSQNYAYALAIQSDGKLLLAGANGPSNSSDTALARYNP